MWINLLSLDAPVVAVVWQSFLAVVYPSVLRPGGRLVLGLTVWVIYLADRLLDVRLPHYSGEAISHRFYRQHHQFAVTLLGIAFSADLALCLLWLRHSVLINGLFVSACVIAYFGIFPALRIGTRWKPIATSILFTAGVFLVAWTGTANPERTFGLPAVAFCLLCQANLALISSWERGISPSKAMTLVVLLLAVCAFSGASKWYAAVALSGFGLLGLILLGKNLSNSTRRVMADAVLLSPLLFTWQ